MKLVNWGQFVVQWLHVGLGADGTPSPGLAAAVGQVKRVAILELGFFLVIFTCMILMRFGL
jgi:hypothetical protein